MMNKPVRKVVQSPKRLSTTDLLAASNKEIDMRQVEIDDQVELLSLWGHSPSDHTEQCCLIDHATPG